MGINVLDKHCAPDGAIAQTESTGVDMKSVPDSRALSDRTVLISPTETEGELGKELAQHGARVLAWPTLDISALETSAALDEAIANLFGYDWLIFQRVPAVDFFLRRFRGLDHEISELDALRVCGVGAEALGRLEQSQVHIDVISDRLSSQLMCAAIENYVGGRDALRGLNFLAPIATSARDYLQEEIENAGGRIDLVATYRTYSVDDPNPVRINALLTGGAVDCIAFASQSQPSEFAAIFDTNDLGRLLAGVAVACIDQDTAQAGQAISLATDIVPKVAEASHLARAIAHHFCAD